jgi:hypothetical protein
MTDQRHDVSFTDTGLRSLRVGSTRYRPTSAPHESVVAFWVDYEGPAATINRITADRLAADEAVAVRMTALYGVHRADGVWVTECAWCKRVRNVAGDWQTLSQSVRSTIRAARTHGICSECADRYLADGDR